MKTIIQCGRLVFVAAAITLASGSAHAALTQLQISYDTTYTGVISGSGIGAETVYLTAFSAQRIGGDPLPIPHSNPFYTFCMDISANLNPTAWWKSGTFATAGDGNALSYQPGGILRAASLYNGYVAGVTFASAAGKQEGAALQLAIWNVLYDNDTSVTGGTGFLVTGADPTVTGRANTMLTGAYNVANPSFTSTFWNATDSNGTAILNQDLIGPQMETGLVPEPGTLMAGISACAYLGFLGIRRKQACN